MSNSAIEVLAPIRLITTVGICSLNSVWKRGLDLIQWLGLIYLAWQLVGLLVNGYGTTTFLMLPVQFAIFVGILIGLSNDYVRKSDQLRFCQVLGWIGIALTAFHATALILSPQPFLARLKVTMAPSVPRTKIRLVQITAKTATATKTTRMEFLVPDRTSKPRPMSNVVQATTFTTLCCWCKANQRIATTKKAYPLAKLVGNR